MCIRDRDRIDQQGIFNTDLGNHTHKLRLIKQIIWFYYICKKFNTKLKIKIMKILTTILTACLFVFALSSCGGDADGSKVSGSEVSGSKVSGSKVSGSEVSGESENSGKDGLSSLEKDVKEFAECMCDYLGMTKELTNDSNNAEELIEKFAVQQEKCGKIEKGLAEKYENAEKTVLEEMELLMDKEMQDCDYQ